MTATSNASQKIEGNKSIFDLNSLLKIAQNSKCIHFYNNNMSIFYIRTKSIHRYLHINPGIFTERSNANNLNV
ncbi:hypothetical protein JZK55_12260 [Dissulfurispira thermophila]|uniref:Uncharacterized protein n=1 Tax=Dissulfurispira thermophila TaxID=2715679 RepID=A0A7G1H0P2_9BACT|nr:hypothetical protein JZK55_12260 [Dissulfurispira thermophila]